MELVRKKAPDAGLLVAMAIQTGELKLVHI